MNESVKDILIALLVFSLFFGLLSISFLLIEPLIPSYLPFGFTWMIISLAIGFVFFSRPTLKNALIIGGVWTFITYSLMAIAILSPAMFNLIFAIVCVIGLLFFAFLAGIRGGIGEGNGGGGYTEKTEYGEEKDSYDSPSPLHYPDLHESRVSKDAIWHYDSHGNRVGESRISKNRIVNTISHYGSRGNLVGKSVTSKGMIVNTILHYNKFGDEIGESKVHNTAISHYDAKGENVGESRGIKSTTIRTYRKQE